MNLYTRSLVQKIFEISSLGNDIVVNYFRDHRTYFNSSNDVEVRLVIYVKNLTLKLLTERNKVFNGILSVRPALYFSATHDTKSFFIAQPIFLSIIIREEVLRVLLSTSLPVLSCDPKVEQEVKKCSPFTQKIGRLTTYNCLISLIWVISYLNLKCCRVSL